MIHSKFRQELKEVRLDRELDMYNYGFSCGLLSFLDLDAIRTAFIGKLFTQIEIDAYLGKIFLGFYNGSRR